MSVSKKMIKVISYLALISGLMNPISAIEHPLTPSQQEAVVKTLEDHLMKNPELIVTSIQRYQEKQEKLEADKSTKAIQQNAQQIFQNTTDFVIGNPQGKTNVVVFMDPFCGYCRRFHLVLEELIQEKGQDKSLQQVRLIYKDLPILGESSDIAVRAMLAAKRQGKYKEFQQEMYKQEGDLTQADILRIATQLGVKGPQLVQDMDSPEIKAAVNQNLKLASELGIGGTPTLIIGKSLSSGALSLSDLKEKIVDAEKASPST